MARIVGLASRLASRLLQAAGLGLVVFHVWLFASMVADGRLTEPAVAFRWAVAAGLAVGLVSLRRAGLPLFTSRRGAALWVLVVLLHASAFTNPAGPAPGGTTDTVALLFVLPATSAGVAAAAAHILERARAGAASRPAISVLRGLWRLAEPALPPYRDHGSASLSPRAPPLTIVTFC
jgi:hypothetical protein